MKLMKLYMALLLITKMKQQTLLSIVLIPGANLSVIHWASMKFETMKMLLIR